MVVARGTSGVHVETTRGLVVNVLGRFDTPALMEVNPKFSTGFLDTPGSSLYGIPFLMVFLESNPVTGHLGTPTSVRVTGTCSSR